MLTAVVFLVIGAGAGGCTARSAAPTRGTMTANGVAVSVTLAGSGRERALTVTFRPEKPGFHIYSIDLPDGGIDGLGIPTRISVGPGLTAVDHPTADRPVRQLRIAGVPQPLPVYPDGAVTFTLHVTRSGSADSAVTVSYGACSERQCLIPVENRKIQLSTG